VTTSDSVESVAPEPVAAEAAAAPTDEPAESDETPAVPLGLYPGGTPATMDAPVATAPGRPMELVSRGLAFSVGAIPIGMASAVIIWKMGFVGAISSFALAACAVLFYTKGALAPPRKGVVPLVGVVLVGIAASFFAVVASDLMSAWKTSEVQSLGYPSEYEFIKDNLFYGKVISSYGSTLVQFVLFGLLGTAGTIFRLLRDRKA
jgi:hypothetical protein